MRIKSPVLAVFALTLVVGLLGQTARAQFKELVKRIPSDANTVILLNAEKIFTSKLAQREGWRTNLKKAYESGMVRLPPDTQQYLMAAALNFEDMEPIWEVGAITVSEARSLKDLAAKKGGTIETLAGRDAVLLPTNTYLVQFDSNTLGSYVPGNRQAVSRWVRSSDVRGGSMLSAYIMEAIGYAEGAGTEIIMAMDLQDIIDTDYTKSRLEDPEEKYSQIVKKYKLDVNQTASVLASARGMMLGITIGDKPFGKIKIDFAKDASILKDAAGPMLVEVLGNRGVLIEDFESWKASVNGKQVTVEGYFSASGMRKVFTLIDAPANTAAQDPSQGQSSASDIDPKAFAARQYFQSVTGFLDELRHRDSPQRIAQIGGWLEKYARKIDRLPMVNVDSDALDYGSYVANQLRNASAAIKGIGMRSRVRQVNAVNSGGPGYYGNNYYNGGYQHRGVYYHGGMTLPSFNYQAGLQWQQRQRTQIKTQEKVSGVAAARAIMTEVEEASAQVRRQMTEKYQIEF